MVGVVHSCNVISSLLAHLSSTLLALCLLLFALQLLVSSHAALLCHSVQHCCDCIRANHLAPPQLQSSTSPQPCVAPMQRHR